MGEVRAKLELPQYPARKEVSALLNRFVAIIDPKITVQIFPTTFSSPEKSNQRVPALLKR